MDGVFGSIEEWSKQLSNKIKDLDDIRAAMATLKDIRENEIRIERSLEPIEVSALFTLCFQRKNTSPSFI